MSAIAIDRELLGRDFPLPSVEDGDKESKGRLLVVAGSRFNPGAALLCAEGAMRAGAGKLQILTAASVSVPVAVAMPEALVVGLDEEPDGGFAKGSVDRVRTHAQTADTVIAGPGMAQGAEVATIARLLMAMPAQLVLDAAMLRSLADLPRGREDRTPVLLPHAGEMSAMIGCSDQDVERDPIGCGRRAADRFGAHVLVKGAVSHIVAADGQVFVHRGGSPGLGVSGSGDTLAGIVGGLLARGADPLAALAWGVLLHGEAGAALERSVGPIGFLAREIPGQIPALMPR